jgi:hypothetical protein
VAAARPAERVALAQAANTSACWWYGSLEIGFHGRGGPLDRVLYLQVEKRTRQGRFGGHNRLRLRDDGFRSIVADRPGLKRLARARGIPLIPIDSRWHGGGFLAPGGVMVWFADEEHSDVSRFGTFITERLAWCHPLRIPAPVGFLRRFRGSRAQGRPGSPS